MKAGNKRTFPESQDNLADKRQQQDKKYMQEWQEGRRMRKKKWQMELLKEYFQQEPVWAYAKKMSIADEIGMTVNQVSKWNWDERRLNNMSTSRKKKD